MVQVGLCLVPFNTTYLAVKEELARCGKARHGFGISVSEQFDEGLRREPFSRIARAQEQGVDRLVIEVFPPFDLRAIVELGKALYE